MSTYENAPATKMLASHCACCSRPLVDAESVERGVGPDCAKKYGFGKAQGPANWLAFDAALALIDGLDGFGPMPLGASIPACGLSDDETRSLANRIVHRIALDQTGPNVLTLTNALAALGFEKLANCVAKRIAQVVIALEDDDRLGNGSAVYSVRGPYSEESVKILRTVPGRRWNAETKRNVFPEASKAQLFAALRRCYPGATATGPKGLFVLAAAS